MNRTSRILLLAAFFVGASLAPAARAAAYNGPPDETQSAAQDEALYAQGNKAMNEQRWSDAVSAFDRAAAVKGKREDASLYWKAYSLNKLGRKDEARATCDSLRKEQPSSSWNRECVLLRAGSVTDVTALVALSKADALQNMDLSKLNVELGALNTGDWQVFSETNGKGFYSNRPTTEDDIKILALNGLMRQDPAKALPLLRDLLKSDKPVEMRRQALFVLSRSKDPQAQAILTEVATTKGNPEMQRQAIEILALNRGKDAGPTLVEIYRGATDGQVKRACINGLFLAHDAPRLVELARGEKDLNLKRDIVSQLALMHDQAATDYMLELLK
ncbi:MAG TPA: HEAT repeat domain-containing protein [Acidobacteriaceae bacterium]|nr:HEAT repeat domain-containing protein [Acidobacteriaceae bacterium]